MKTGSKKLLTFDVVMQKLSKTNAREVSMSIVKKLSRAAINELCMEYCTFEDLYKVMSLEQKARFYKTLKRHGVIPRTGGTNG